MTTGGQESVHVRFLSSILCAGILVSMLAACGHRDSSTMETAMLSVSIEDTVNVPEPKLSVLFNCISETGDRQSIVADEKLKGKYIAEVPILYKPARDFITIYLDGNVYRYATSNTRFEAGRCYEYAFKMTADGLVPANGQDIEINGWHVIHIDVEIG